MMSYYKEGDLLKSLAAQLQLARQELASEKSHYESLAVQLQSAMKALSGEKAQKDALYGLLQRTYTSTSWRLTEPLRKGQKKLSSMIIYTLRVLRYITRGVLRMLLHYPQLQRLGAWVLKGHPYIKQKLIQAAEVQSVGQLSTVNKSSLKSKYSNGQSGLNYSSSKLTKLSFKEAGQSKFIDLNKPRIFYWIDHTSKYEANSGIQRVTRRLSRALMELDTPLIFVCWNEEKKSLVTPATGDLKHISKWNGPVLSHDALDAYSRSHYMADVLHEQVDLNALKNSWLIIPEVTSITY